MSSSDFPRSGVLMNDYKQTRDDQHGLGKLVESCCKDDRVRYVEINFARQKHDTGRTNGVGLQPLAAVSPW